MKHAKQLGLFTTLFFAFFIILNSCSTSPNNNGGTSTTVIPVAPSNLTGTVVSNSRVDLSWTDNSTNETGFKVERRLDGGNYAVRGTVNADILNYSDTGLSPYTNYTYRVYSFNAAGNSITYSNEFSISTGGVPVLSTNTIDSITYTTAKSGGNITNDGRSPVTARGVVWSTSPNPTISLSTKTIDGSGSGTFISRISGLNRGTSYYLRAYATNANGTGYGNEQIFLTNVSLPTVTTTIVTSIGDSTAISGGNVTDDGGSPVTERGVVWSRSPNPIVIMPTKTIDGSGTGSFTSNITGLIAPTSYRVRAYATNSVGTAYGDELAFVTVVAPYSYTQGPNVTDVDGNSYPSITTNCGQTWTTKNLNVSRYRNGDIIPQVTDTAIWRDLTTGAWCYYSNNTANGVVYGKLYNWYAVNDIRGLAPTGWHIPSLTEWNKFIKCIDWNASDTIGYPILSTSIGGSMKESGGAHWSIPNVGATNASGFTGLGAGRREYNVNGAIGGVCYWWSSSQYSSTSQAWQINLINNDAGVYRDHNLMTTGYSVRIIKD